MVSSTYLLDKFNKWNTTHIHSSNDVDTLDLIHICFGNKTTKHQLDVMQHKIDRTFKNTYVIVVTKYAWHNESTNKFATYLDVQHAFKPLNWGGQSRWKFRVFKWMKYVRCKHWILFYMLKREPSSTWLIVASIIQWIFAWDFLQCHLPYTWHSSKCL